MSVSADPGLKFFTVKEITDPLLICESVTGIGYGEVVKVITPSDDEKMGRVIDVSDQTTVIQVFEGTSGLEVDTTAIRFTGEPFRLPVSTDMLGRMLTGRGEPADDGPKITPEDYLDIHGATINPYSREHPSKFIETGISVIDGLNTLLLGQKLPILSGTGLPHKRLASQIVRQAEVVEEEEFTIVLAAMGITADDVKFFRDDFLKMGALDRVVMFVNLAEEPAIERILTPRLALTTAEYFAFQQNLHVLVLMVDMTNYCEALREISAARLEIPGRRGYPGYMYTDLANLYERAGIIRGRKGSITQMPILTMPDDDITHPIADLTNYITEGQIILDREMFKRGIYPPIDPLPCLSRLMDEGVGANKTREDHKQLSDQLYYAYAEGKTVQKRAMVSGEKALTTTDKLYLKFMEQFETEFISQSFEERREIEETLDLGWNLLSILPKAELTRIDPHIIEEYHPKQKEDDKVPPE